MWLSGWFRRWLLVSLVLSTLVVIRSSGRSLSYELKSFATFQSRSPTHQRPRVQQVHTAKFTLKWSSTFDQSVLESSAYRLQCGETVRFESIIQPPFDHNQLNLLLISSDAAPIAQRAAKKVFKTISGLSSFQSDSSSDSDRRTSTIWVLLHQLPTRRNVNHGLESSVSSSESDISDEFGGWPESISPCNTTTVGGGGGMNDLSCCNLYLRAPRAPDWDGLIIDRRVELEPLVPYLFDQPNSNEDPPVSDTLHPIDVSTKQNLTDILLAWRHSLHALIAATPVPIDPILRPLHLPPTRELRRAFLRAALKRKELIRLNARDPSHPDRKHAKHYDEDHPANVQATAFVEQSGWSTTALADILTGGVEPGMSARTQAIVAPTSADEEQVGAVMTDMTTTFLQAMEQVKTHLKAGVGARQIIALVCNKMVLRDMPPKVGVAIVKSLQQAVLNILKETISDMLTQYFVPPGSMGAFVEKNALFRPVTEHSVMMDTIEKVRQVNPIMAEQLESVDREHTMEQMNAFNEREEKRREQMEQVLFLETESNVLPSSAPLPPPAVESPDSDSKYDSFLATYSASALRHAAKVGVSGNAIGDKIKDFLTPMITNGVIHDATAQLENLLHVLLHESLSDTLHEDISASLVASLTPSLTDSVGDSQIALLSTTLRTQLTRELTHHMTRGLTMSITPGLSLILTRALTRSPHYDYYCHICDNPIEGLEKPAEFHLDPPADADPSKPYCLSCEHSKENEYYLDYYTSYYAKYYATYFSFYYSDFYARKFHEAVVGTCKVQPCHHAL